ncbi:MAG: hypothetical protein GY705_09460 [Bacteroidetes bacterium]|nr:hypothetical protein [Bacteroidota bacterium]
MKYKKTLTRFEGKSFYLLMCVPFVCIIFGVLYLIAASRIGGLIDLNLVDIFKIWISGPVYDKAYSGMSIKAVGCLVNAFLQFGLALCSGILFHGVSKSRLMYREIVLILKKHNEWTDV